MLLQFKLCNVQKLMQHFQNNASCNFKSVNEGRFLLILKKQVFFPLSIFLTCYCEEGYYHTWRFEESKYTDSPHFYLQCTFTSFLWSVSHFLLQMHTWNIFRLHKSGCKTHKCWRQLRNKPCQLIFLDIKLFQAVTYNQTKQHW